MSQLLALEQRFVFFESFQNRRLVYVGEILYVERSLGFISGTVILFTDEIILASKDLNGRLRVEKREGLHNGFQCLVTENTISLKHENFLVSFVFNAELSRRLRRAIYFAPPLLSTGSGWSQGMQGCIICSVKFNIVVKKRYCHRCGALVCSACSSTRAKLFHEAKVRTCKDCHFHFVAAKADDKRILDSVKVILLRLCTNSEMCFLPTSLISLVIDFLDSPGGWIPDACVEIYTKEDIQAGTLTSDVGT